MRLTNRDNPMEVSTLSINQVTIIIMVHVIINSNLDKEKYSKIPNLFREGDTNEFKEFDSGYNSGNIILIIQTTTSIKTNYLPTNTKS